MGEVAQPAAAIMRTAPAAALLSAFNSIRMVYSLSFAMSAIAEQTTFMRIR
jgi:hypothetical protein